MTPNSEDDNKQVEQQVTVDDILQQDNNTDTFTLYGYCPNCKEIHGDLNRIVEYLQWLSNQSMISFN